MTILDRLRTWARALKRDVTALAFAARDPRTPWWVKLFALAIVAYALSPIDLIPDFIPVIGLLDELILLPLALRFLLAAVPAPVLADARAKAEHAARLPPSRAAAAVIIVIWLLALAALAWWWWPR
jgi:uncharacterized membrane protein YkvA (DUF1232 family)